MPIRSERTFSKNILQKTNFKTATTAYNRCEQAIVAHTLLHADDAERKAAACTYPQSTLISTRRIPVSEYRFSHVQSLRTLVSTKGWPYFLQIPEKLLIAAFYGVIVLSFVNTFPWNHLWHWVFPAGLVLLRWIAVWSHHIGYRIHLGDKNLFYTAPLWDIFAPFSYFRYLILLLFKKYGAIRRQNACNPCFGEQAGSLYPFACQIQRPGPYVYWQIGCESFRS